MTTRIAIVAHHSRDAVNFARNNGIDINAKDVRVLLSPSDIRGLSLTKEQVVYTPEAYRNLAYAEMAAALDVVFARSTKPTKAVPPMYRAVIHDADGEVIAERGLTARQVRELVG